MTQFLTLDSLDVSGKRIVNYSFRLIPVLADAIAPDPDVAALVREIRGPHQDALGKVLGRTDSLLYRRGNFAGTFDDLICQALIAERDVEIALSPGFRWGSSLLPGQEIRLEDVYDQTAITYPTAYRTEMTGAALKDILEDVADNLFNPDPYYQQGGDMVRVGGMQYTIDPAQTAGNRISDMRLNGKSIEAGKTYKVAGWAPVSEDAKNAGGEAIWDVIERHLKDVKVVKAVKLNEPVIKGVANNPGMAPI